MVRSLIRCCKGGTAIEYGLIAALIVVAMLGALTEFAHVEVNMWNDVSNKVQTAG